MQGWLLDTTALMPHVERFFLPFIRVAALMSSAPFIGSRLIPVRVRLLLAIMITFIIFPSIKNSVAFDSLSFVVVILIATQIIIGVIMGFILQLVFNAVSLAGENIAMTMGLGFAQMVDPQNGVQVPIVSQFYVISGSLLFLVMDGHLSLIYLIHHSFSILPVGQEVVSRESIWLVLSWVSSMFIGAVMIALPAITALLIINFSMGVMTRSAPQLNIFSVGFPVSIMVGFGLLWLTLPGYTPVFLSLMEQAFNVIDAFIMGAG